ncbi:MAG: hypothetical protein Q8R28_05790 [Dehalococcoidia bacterium]|nr:hypothetical protein [Dehalococcoidia bacterium]
MTTMYAMRLADVRASLTPTHRRRIRRWIAALRSGKYKQGMFGMRNREGGNEYCCLGVACDISGLGRWTHTGVVYLGSSSVWPSEVSAWYGLPSTIALKINGHWDTLAAHNDTGRRFSSIATALERQVLGVKARPSTTRKAA